MLKSIIIFSFCGFLINPLFSAVKKNNHTKLEKALNSSLVDLRISPAEPNHYFKTAQLYRRMGKNEKAASIYKRLLNNRTIKDINAKFKANFFLASIYLFDKKFQPAIHYYKQAVELKPLSTAARINLGTAYLNSKSYYSAINEYQLVLTNNPNYAIVYYNLGKSFEKLNKFDLARNNYRSFLSILKKDGKLSLSKYSKYIKIANSKINGKNKKSRIIKTPKVIDKLSNT